jgi:predicted DNA-binding protein with PD1-like motif
LRVRTVSGHPQKVHVVVLQTGEEAVTTLLDFARDEDVRSAQVTAIGAFSDIVLGFYDPEKRRYEEIPIREQVELLTLSGNLTEEDGEHRLHASVAVGKRDGTAHGGQLVRGLVRPTLEVIVVEVAAELRRKVDPETGLALIEDIVRM